jgi:hypothetical protein
MKITLPISVAVFLLAASAAQAATIVEFSGNSNGSLATGTATISFDGGVLTGTITNTSPHDARITGFGFDIGAGNLNDFFGSPEIIEDPEDVKFAFEDDSMGNVPQFNDAELDFGYMTGKNFNGGKPNLGLDNFETLSFMITGAFGNLTETEIASGLFVRYQRVGADGNGSDVAAVNDISAIPPVVNPAVVPEPASMVLLGTGLLYLARRRTRGESA